MTWRVVQRAMRACAGAIASALACVGVGAGMVTAADGHPSWTSLLGVVAVTALLAAAVVRRLRFVAPSARAARASRWSAAAPLFADVEIGLAICAATYTLIEVTGGFHGPLQPVIYAVVAFAFSCQGRVSAVVVLLAVTTLEIAAWSRADGQALSLFAHVGLLVGAALVHAALVRGVVASLRRYHLAQVAEDVMRRRASARDYRLFAAALSTDSRGGRARSDEEQLLAAGSAETVNRTVYYVLSLLKRSLSATTCVLLWLDDRAEHLVIKELISDDDSIVVDPPIELSGAVGAIIRDRGPIALAAAKPGQIAYYPADSKGRTFLGVPVTDGLHLRGVLCVDREQPFMTGDTELVTAGAEQVIHAIRSERVFAAIERAKYEHERFYQASAMLCRALTLEQVVQTAFDASAAIADYDFGCVTLVTTDRKKHRIVSVRARPGVAPMINVDDLNDLEFRDNTGLVSMVVKNRHYLPAAGELRDAATPVFTKQLRFRSVESLLVLPLLSADEAIGTLTLASTKRHRFRKDVREMLGVIANQVAISIQNALMYRQMETMATTDGLTGLTNHRTFQERFADLLERSARYGHPAAVLLCDVDHFKNVNDTYGHPVGDEVLRRVAKVLADAVRKIDIPARYGGEEFAVVLESTDEVGAARLAERIRQDVGRLVVETDKGPLTITMSIGLASFPRDGDDKATLIEHADHALYHAKQSGRNRVVSYREFCAARSRRAG